MKETHCTVHGMVQGVWFRAWTADMARELNLAGWVRNRSDGTVEALAQGDEAALKRFIERLYMGPPLARVTSVDVLWREPETVIPRFEVRT